MTNAHTPGPWSAAHIERECTLRRYHNIYMPGSAGAAVYSMGCAPDEAAANARLIASAPDLLKSLEAIVARVTGEFDATALEDFGPLSTWAADDILALARAAIARATGEA